MNKCTLSYHSPVQSIGIVWSGKASITTELCTDSYKYFGTILLDSLRSFLWYNNIDMLSRYILVSEAFERIESGLQLNCASRVILRPLLPPNGAPRLLLFAELRGLLSRGLELNWPPEDYKYNGCSQSKLSRILYYCSQEALSSTGALRAG